MRIAKNNKIKDRYPHGQRSQSNPMKNFIYYFAFLIQSIDMLDKA